MDNEKWFDDKVVDEYVLYTGFLAFLKSKNTKYINLYEYTILDNILKSMFVYINIEVKLLPEILVII